MDFGSHIIWRLNQLSVILIIINEFGDMIFSYYGFVKILLTPWIVSMG